MADIGADRGIVLSVSGFQSGAVEAANLTNVQFTSIAALSLETANDISAMQLRELFDRIESCKGSYWELDKEHRIEAGLRPEVGGHGYSGIFVMDFCRELLSRAFRGLFPIEMGMSGILIDPAMSSTFSSSQEVLAIAEPLIQERERKLEATHNSPGIP